MTLKKSGTSKLLYQGYKFKSLAEKLFAKELDSKKVSWAYEKHVFNYTPPKSIYTPDFMLVKKLTLGDSLKDYIFIEFKGYLRREHMKTLRAVKAEYPDADIRLVFMNAKQKPQFLTKMTNAQWAEKYGFPWAEKNIPDDWVSEVD